jgi:hypothetical protein
MPIRVLITTSPAEYAHIDAQIQLSSFKRPAKGDNAIRAVRQITGRQTMQQQPRRDGRATADAKTAVRSATAVFFPSNRL